MKPIDSSKWRWVCLIPAILSGLYLSYPRLRGLFYNAKAASIGIIGGADGPTAIFVTSKISWQPVKIIAILLLILGITGFIALSKHAKK